MSWLVGWLVTVIRMGFLYIACDCRSVDVTIELIYLLSVSSDDLTEWCE